MGGNMILSRNTEGENIVVFDDFVLQIIMGQWLGVLPDSSKRGFLLSFYKEPKNANEFQKHRISKKKLEKIESEVSKLLKVFDLQDEIYLINNFDQEKQTFFCNLPHRGETAFIQYLFHRILTFPSSFIVTYHNIQTKYSFVTDPNSHENILVSIDKKRFPTTREFSSFNFYKIESLEQDKNIEIEYQHQLKSLDKEDSVINYNQLYEGFENLNNLSVSIFDVASLLSQVLKEDISNYRKIRIGWNNRMGDGNRSSVLEMLNGQIKKLQVEGHEANRQQREKVINIFLSKNYDDSNENLKRK